MSGDVVILAGWTSITYAGMGILTRFAELEDLNLVRSRITDVGALSLIRCTKLKNLHLSGTSVSEPVVRAQADSSVTPYPNLITQVMVRATTARSPF